MGQSPGYEVESGHDGHRERRQRPAGNGEACPLDQLTEVVRTGHVLEQTTWMAARQ